MNDHIPEYLKDRYPTICPLCGNDFNIIPSMFMTMGLNTGCVSCPSCRSFLHVEISPYLDGDHMESQLWDEYMKQKDDD